MSKISLFETKQKHEGIIYYLFGIKIWTDKKSIKRLIRSDNDITVDNKIKKIIPQPHLEQLSIHLAEHCNLNCQMCDNFSPLAKKEFTNLKNLEKDIKRLANLSNSQIDTIELLGGEPLLHPHINDALKIVRSVFPCSNIRIITNGILLSKMSVNFWKAAHEHNIAIAITRYPIALDIGKIMDLSHRYGIITYIYNKDITKTSYHIPFDITGGQDPRVNFINCFHANHCVYLQNGKIYTCSIAACVRHFNHFFKKNLPDNESNGIDIYKASTMSEILEFLAKPIPLCKYCNVLKRSYNHPWKVSQKTIEEWGD